MTTPDETRREIERINREESALTARVLELRRDLQEQRKCVQAECCHPHSTIRDVRRICDACGYVFATSGATFALENEGGD